MASQKVEISMRKVAWNDEAERLLAGAAGNDPTYTLSDIRREVEGGTSDLFVFHYGTEKLGYAVLWFDNYGGTKELVLQCGEAFMSWRRAAHLALQVIKAYAIKEGCHSMRSHIQRGDRLAVMMRAGFRRSEIVVKQSF